MAERLLLSSLQFRYQKDWGTTVHSYLYYHHRGNPYRLLPTLTCSWEQRVDERVQGWFRRGDTSPSLVCYDAIIVITSVFNMPALLSPRVVIVADGCGFSSRGSSGKREETKFTLGRSSNLGTRRLNSHGFEMEKDNRN
ncbi:hypothetical protein KC354_g47 [Hortaea werneckii]|nr:hypothetical protein KC354_g47 [Hortaea werneckii]